MAGQLLNPFAFRTYQAVALPGTVPFNTYASFHYDWYWPSYSGNTIDLLIEYYANLLILQYVGQPRAYATVQEFVRPVMMENLPLEVQSAFNMIGSTDELAVGVQLDIIGKYVGVSRSGYGFNAAITLDDADFLTLIQMAIVRNRSGSSLGTIQALLAQFFAGDVFVFDYTNMQMSYLISTTLGSQELIQLFVTEGLLPRPMGVSLSVIAAPTVNKFFGLRTYDGAASVLTTPLQTYDSYNTAWLWLSYTYAITI